MLRERKATLSLQNKIRFLNPALGGSVTKQILGLFRRFVSTALPSETPQVVRVNSSLAGEEKKKIMSFLSHVTSAVLMFSRCRGLNKRGMSRGIVSSFRGHVKRDKKRPRMCVCVRGQEGDDGCWWGVLCLRACHTADSPLSQLDM